MPIADIDYTEYFTQEALAKLKANYDKADADGDGKINEAELVVMMKKQGRNMSRHQVRDCLKSVDYNNSGFIDFEEVCMLEILLGDLKPRPELIDYRDYLKEKEIKLLETEFAHKDVLQNGKLFFEGCWSIMQQMQVEVAFEAMQAYYKQVDPQGEGIDFPQLCALYAVAVKRRRKCNYREFLSREQILSFRKLFSNFDTRGTGRISFQDVEQVLRRMGVQVKKTQLTLLINSFDLDGSGDIDIEEFCVMMLRLKGTQRQQTITPSTHKCEDLYRKEDFSVKELQECGFDIADFREAGIPIGALVREGGLSALELRRAGYTPQELRHGGLGAEELRRCGFSLAELRNAGFSDCVLRAANHSLKGSLSAGDLSPLPQRRPFSKEGISRPVRGATLMTAGAAQLVQAPSCPWQLPDRPMTSMIREHTDWRPMLSRAPSKPRLTKKESLLLLQPEGL